MIKMSRHNKARFSLVRACALLVLLATNSATANITIVNMDGLDEGFNDTTPVLPVGGNPGETLGQQRINVFNEAARLIALELDIRHPIKVEAKFDPQACSASSGTLGAAGPAAFTIDPNTMSIVPDALQNQLSRRDVGPERADIKATFNSAIDNNSNCLANTNWYYGFDKPPGFDISLLSTVMHELIHGLGFVSVLQNTGESYYSLGFGQYLYDPFTDNLKDGTTGKLLREADANTRRLALTSETQLLWNGKYANDAAAEHTSGLSAGQLQMYAPATYSEGSSVSHFNTNVTPNELMEPFDTGFNTSSALSFAALRDIGWPAAQQPPELAPIGDQTLEEDQRLETEISAVDADNSTLSFSVTSDQPALNVAIRETNTRVYLVIDPEENFYGEGFVTVTVSDGNLTDEETLKVTISPVNDLPIISNNDVELVTREEQPLTISINATDIDSPSLTYSVNELDDDVVATVSGNRVTLSPAQDKSGTYPFTVNVSDGDDSVDLAMVLYVENVNDLPYLDINGSIIEEDTDWLTAFFYGDVDGQRVTLNASADVANTQLEISGDGSTGLLKVTPPKDFFGNIEVTVAVTENPQDVAGTDASPATTAKTITLEVSPVNDEPRLENIANLSITPEGSSKLVIPFIDTDNDAIVSVSSESPKLVRAEIIDGVLQLSSPLGYSGSVKITLTISDEVYSSTQTFSVNVKDGKPRPEIVASIDSEEISNGDSPPIYNQAQVEPFRLTISRKIGDWNFSLVYNNEERSDLIESKSDSEVIILVPSAGAFAGVYELIAYDVDDIVAPLSVVFSRPPAYSMNADPLLIGSDQGRLNIRGLKAGTSITAVTYDNQLQLFNPAQGEDLPVVTLDDPDNQNETSIGLQYPASTEDNTESLIDFSAGGLLQENISITGRKGINHTVEVADENDQVIADATLTLINGNLEGWGVNDTQLTDESGQISFSLPPSEIQLHVTRDGFHPEKLDVIISEENPDTSVILQSRSEFYSLELSIFANNFDFSNTLPVILIEFANGDIEKIDLMSTTTTTAYARWLWDWSGPMPIRLIVTHEDATEYSVLLDTRLNSESKEVDLLAKPGLEQREEDSNRTETEINQSESDSGTDQTEVDSDQIESNPDEIDSDVIELESDINPDQTELDSDPMSSDPDRTETEIDQSESDIETNQTESNPDETDSDVIELESDSSESDPNRNEQDANQIETELNPDQIESKTDDVELDNDSVDIDFGSTVPDLDLYEPNPDKDETEIEQTESVESTEVNESPSPDEKVTGESGGSSGGGNAAGLLITALLLLGRRRTRRLISADKL